MRAMVGYLCRIAPDAVVSSPTLHAVAVAKKLAASIGLEPAVVNEGWCEVNHGEWEGLRYEEVVQRFGAGTAQRFNDPLHYTGHGGETLAEVNRRVNLSWEGLIATTGDVITLISHATPISLVLCRCAEIPPSKHRLFRLDNNSVTRIDVTGTSIEIDSVNHRIEP